MTPQDKIKKIILLIAFSFVFLAVLITSYFVLKTKFGTASISQQIGSLLAGAKSSEAEKKQLDSDNDGLKDWEEKIYKTDQKNPDTDDDGYLDGEEVATGYDPTKKAPNDEILNANSKTPRPLPQNLTKALSLKLSEGIVNGNIKSFNKNGEPLNTKELEQQMGLEQAIQAATGQALNEFTLPAISNSDIKISDKNGKQAATDYLNSMQGAITKIGSKNKSEIQLFIDAMEKNDFTQLEKIRLAYEESYNKLKEMAVPPDLIFFHKGILGVIQGTQDVYRAIQNINQDPLKATIAILQYKQIDAETNHLIAQLTEQIKKY